MCDRIEEFFHKLSPQETKKPSSDSSSADSEMGWLNILCFCVFGILTFFNQEMLFTAAQDILSGRQLPTATILVCFVTPLTITKIIAPWFVQAISYVVKVFFIALFMTLGLILIVFFDDINVKLVGIALNAIATGASEVIFLSLTSFYPQICISAFVAGTGMASLVAPLYYTGLTTWSCTSPKTAILIIIPLPLVDLVFYAMLDKDYITNGPYSRRKGHIEVEYTMVASTSDAADQVASNAQKSPYGEKLRIAWKILPYIIPLVLSFFAEYLSHSSVITTIAFPNSQILPRDHFLYYFFSYEIGKFVGRSYLFMFACLPTDAIEFLKCRKTWIFAVLEIAHLIFFIFESWYHFVWYIWIIIFLCSTLGLIAGMIALHSSHAVAQQVTPEEKEFAMGLVTVGNAVGAFAAGLLGLVVEPYLTEKCVEHFSASKEFCFTRQRSTSGWESNIHC